MEPKPRILGLDVGSKTIGLAVSDPLGITAQGLNTIRRKNKRHDFEQEYQNSQYHQKKLVPTTRFKNIPEYITGDAGYRVLGFLATAITNPKGHHPTNPKLVGRRSGGITPGLFTQPLESHRGIAEQRLALGLLSNAAPMRRPFRG